MSNKDQRDNISSVSDQTKVQNVQTNRSNYDVTLMNPGPPALYQLNTERKYFVETDKKVRQWTYGRRDRNKQNKVILMVGETGAGKTTMINTMVNYLLGVKFEDEEFYQITEEKENQDQTQSQTSEITVYEVFVEENPTSLTIIDTPGYGDNEGYEKDIEISKYLMKLFSDEEGIRYIDAVCFVIKASVNRLSGKEHYIFHSVLSLFGKDIEENIVFLFTHSDGGRPRDALSAIKKAEIPSRKDEDNQPVYFLFSNRQKEERDEESKHSDRSVWEMGERSINRFLTSLEEKNRKSVKMTLDVLKERRQLEACVSNLMERIYEKELQSEELEQIQEALKKNKDKIEKDENFDFKVKKVFKEKVPIVNEWWWNSKATCCSKCKENCHLTGCWCAKDPSSCEVMKNNKCTVCTGRCPPGEHKKENQKYVTKTKETTMTFYELKSMLSTLDRPQNKTEVEKKLNSDLEKNRNEKSKLVLEAYMTIMNLCKIALKADSAFTLRYLDFLIPRLKEEGKEEWMKNLEDLRKTGAEQKNKGALQYVMDATGKKYNQFLNFFK